MILCGRIIGLPRHWTMRRWLFRSPLGGWLHSAVHAFWIVGLSLLVVLAGSCAVGAITYKEPCPFYDAKRGWGHDVEGHTCRRRD